MSSNSLRARASRDMTVPKRNVSDGSDFLIREILQFAQHHDFAKLHGQLIQGAVDQLLIGVAQQ